MSELEHLFAFKNKNVHVPLTYTGRGLCIPFSNTEDDLIRKLANIYVEDWATIQEKFNEVKPNHINRSSQVLRARWRDYLNPNLPLPFSSEEDNLIREKVNEFGDRAFDKIQRFLS